MTPTDSIEEHIKTLTHLYMSNLCHGKSPTFASQKYSKKIQDKMNFQLLKHKEFKQDKNKKLRKNYAKFSGMLMVKKPVDQRYQIYDEDDNWS